MSLSAREQQALDSITDRLAGSDPELAALLTGFTRLASGEEMPPREKIRAGSPPAIRCSRLSGARTRAEHLSWSSILSAGALPPRIPRRVPHVRVACAARS